LLARRKVIEYSTDLVILGVPLVRAGSFLQPLLELRNCEEILPLLSFRHLASVSWGGKSCGRCTTTYSDNRRNKLDKEIVELEERGIEMIEEVDDKAFDMRTVVILENLSK
jgi:hypothetical protein